jgi:hypothetical protein
MENEEGNNRVYASQTKMLETKIIHSISDAGFYWVLPVQSAMLSVRLTD